MKRKFVPTEEENSLSLAEVRGMIEKMEDMVIDKRTKEYKEWELNFNRLLLLYNHKIGWRAYKPLI